MDMSADVLQQLASKTKSLFFVFDPDQKVFLYLSDFFSVYFGINSAKVIREPRLLFSLIFPEDQEYVMKKLGSLEKNACIEIDIRLLVKGNSLKWLHCRACKLGDEQQYTGCIIGYAEDITVRKKYELNLYNTHAQKDVALQILGHDLRSPISTIYAATALLQKQVKEEDMQQIMPFFQIINSTCRNALNLIGEILNSVYWDTQKNVQKKERIDLVEMVGNQIKAYNLLHHDEKSFLLHHAEDSVHVSSDPIRLQLILENLLSNAYKFTKAYGKIEIHISQDTDKVLITVSDDGIGIPEKLQPMIFQKFTKARRDGMQGEKSTGLGLHIVKNLVKQLSGKIWFSSMEGKGTTFFVELPKGSDE